MKLHHVAHALHAEGMGNHWKAADKQGISPAFGLRRVVGTLVKELSVHGAQVFHPLAFQMDQRPLSAAKGEMLDTGDGQVLFFPNPGHTICVQVTPSGRESVSTSTS